jgi:hypothetical protein
MHHFGRCSAAHVGQFSTPLTYRRASFWASFLVSSRLLVCGGMLFSVSSCRRPAASATSAGSSAGAGSTEVQPHPAPPPPRLAVIPPYIRTVPPPSSSPVWRIVRPSLQDTTGTIFACISSLTRNLTFAEQVTLLSLVEARPPASRWSEGVWFHIANNAIDAVLKQRHPLPDLSLRLIALAQRPKTHPVLKDYLWQFMGTWHGPAVRRTDGSAEEERHPDYRRLLREALRQGALTPQAAHAGAALNALDRIYVAQIEATAHGREADGELEPYTALTHTALTVLRDQRQHPAARLCALQICSRYHLSEIVPDLRSIIDHAQPEHRDQVQDSLPLVASALSALGSLGEASVDSPRLTVFSASPDLRLASAATAALHHFSAPASH